jgi:hypothetical protein
MKTITPREFRNAFMAVMKAEHIAFRTAVGFEAKSYAYFVRTNILPRIAKNLGLLTWNKEYYGIDSMFYEERGADAFGNHASFAKRMSAIVEHERVSSKTPETMHKLQLFNVPLKVLLTYAAVGVETDSLLRRYESIIRDADSFADTATLRKQLVIFGTPRTMREWRFYVYESDGFVLMMS